MGFDETNSTSPDETLTLDVTQAVDALQKVTAEVAKIREGMQALMGVGPWAEQVKGARQATRELNTYLSAIRVASKNFHTEIMRVNLAPVKEGVANLQHNLKLQQQAQREALSLEKQRWELARKGATDLQYGWRVRLNAAREEQQLEAAKWSTARKGATDLQYGWRVRLNSAREEQKLEAEKWNVARKGMADLQYGWKLREAEEKRVTGELREQDRVARDTARARLNIENMRLRQQRPETAAARYEQQANYFGRDSYQGLMALRKAYELKLQIAQASGLDNAEVMKNVELLKQVDQELEIQQVKRRERMHYERVAGPGAGFAIGTQLRYLANFALMGAVISAFSKTAEVVSEVDKELYNLQAVTGVSDAALGKLRGTILGVASNSKFLANEVADSATNLLKAGVSVDNLGQALKATATFAQATGSDLKEATNTITLALGAFDLRGNEAMDVANQFMAAISHSRLSVEQFTQALETTAEPAAQLNISYQDLSIAISMMANAGMKSGQALGTGLRSVLKDLERPTKQFTEALKVMHLTFGDVDIRTRGLIPVLKTLRDHGFDAAMAFKSLDARAVPAMLALQSQVDTYQSLSKETVGTQAAIKAAETQMKSFNNAGQRLLSTFTSVVTGAFQPFIQGLRFIEDGLAKVLQLIQPFSEDLTIPAATLGGIALGRFIGYVVRLTSSFGAAIAAGEGFTGVVAALGGPIGIAVAAIGAAVAALGLYRASTEDLNSKIDENKDKITGLQDAYRESGRALEELVTRSDEYRSNSAALENRVGELSLKFKDLGLNLVGVAGDYDQVIAKMRDFQRANLVSQRIKLTENQTALTQVLNRDRQSGELSGRQVVTAFTDVLPFTLRASQADMYNHETGGRYRSIGRLLQSLTTHGVHAGDADRLASAVATLTTAINTDPKNAALNGRVLSVLNGLMGGVGTVLQDQNNLNANKVQLGAVGAMLSPDFQHMEDGALQLIKQLNAAPKFNPSDPGKSRDAMLKARNMLEPQAATLQKQLQSYYTGPGGVVDLSKFRAVQNSGILDQLNGAVLNFESGYQNNVTQAQGPQNTTDGFVFNAAKTRFDMLLAKMKEQNTFPALDKVSKEADKAIVELYSARAKQAADKLKLRPDQYTFGANGLVVSKDATGLQRLGAYAFNSQSFKPDQERQKEAYKAAAGRILSDLSDTISRHITNLTKEVSATFKGVDKDTTMAEIRERAAKAKDELAKAMADDLQKLALEARRLNWSDAELKQKGQELRDKYKLATDSISQKVDQYGTNLKRPVGSFAEAFADIKTTAADPRTNDSHVNVLATTFKDTMLAAIGSVRSGFGGLFSSIVSGTKSAGAAFKAFASNILGSMLKVVSDRAAQQFMNMLFGNMFSAGASAAGAAGTAGATSGLFSSIISSVGSFLGLSGGGLVRYGFGGSVSTRDSVQALLTPGEYVMRQSAVNSIGVDTLNQLNALGNTRISQSANNLMAAHNDNQKPPGQVNVYVVAPDQKPQLGKNDILAVVNDDIMSNGATKKLIKAVTMGM